ncbi:hypothetical protein PF005_g11235 [Phytophthora fragariae]|uniref:Uncharacterized protein n=1 Tax=Phytophthora fragariae TaxID=53985 RepID=A0A6A3ES41_9STRA|nr:hypothetical protein PF003_g14074 [Phytophthora fragariae]KAE8932868.1 hypothetical protein PF009_g17123 [Phytophthora fragariae]KAE8999132.1 hypothetical protein PF011_g14748 [Phytophthora fragariae]KAE9071880.1 hypothetical protein PF010_g25699 [Phytophthora fragariae]KAE9087324.1 hypothetical protein PF007_g20419 [Phytophthora fragariae]
MFALFEEVPTSTSLLMQCGYRSKVCTNIRATKIDGSLHKLCEFHRRKANANQQRLHKRQREERVARRQSGTATKAKEDRPAKKICLNIHIPIDPIVVDPIPYSAPLDQYPNGVFNEELATPTSLTSVDMDMLELLLLDVQPLPLLPPPNSPTSVDEANSIVV